MYARPYHARLAQGEALRCCRAVIRTQTKGQSGMTQRCALRQPRLPDGPAP